MPIYEYECAACQHRFEHLQRNVSDVPVKCPRCSAKKLKKVFSSFGVATDGGRPDLPGPSCSTCTTGSCPYSN